MTMPSYIDLIRRLDPDGSVAKVAEVMNQYNGMFDDMFAMESNLPTGHQITARTALGTPAYRGYNEGVAPSVSRTEQITEGQSMLEDWTEIDRDLAALNGNTADFMASEESAKIEGMMQKTADTLISGNVTTTPKAFNGLAIRYATPSADTDNHGSNMVTGGGSGADNTSIYICGWGPDGLFAHYPPGHKPGMMAGGIMREDLGEVRLTDASGNPYMGRSIHYQMKLGIGIKNWKYVVRICNIDVSDLKKDAATGADLIDLISNGLERLPEGGNVRYAIYCNRTIRSFLRRQIDNKSNLHVTYEDVGGRRVIAFDGIPVRRVDKITNAESTVSGTFAAA